MSCGWKISLALAVATAPVMAAATCESLTSLSLPDATVTSAQTVAAGAFTPPADPNGRGGRGPGANSIYKELPSFCRVSAALKPSSDSDIKIEVWLPAAHWNQKYQAVGNGGWAGVISYSAMAEALRDGYATSSTDTGHVGGSGSFAFGHQEKLIDFGWRSEHEMTLKSKAVIDAYYGNPARLSYWNGCSTGGRQGLSEAQRYPADYDGILSGAPAINWTKLHVEQMWGTVAMLAEKDPVPQCKFAAAQAAAVAACDANDGVKDGVIENPLACKFDPKELVGTSTACGDFTTADADVIRKIWEGPRRQDGSFLWYGLQRGGDFRGLSSTGGTPLAPRPNPITLEWWRYFLNRNPQWDYMNLTPASYELYWDQSVEEFSAVLATDNPDLSAFRDHGGKIVLWHGWSDQLIYPEGTIDYYQRVQKQMGGAQDTAKFARLFLAPGVEHCGGGPGPSPEGQFDAVVKWVEQGQAPETLTAVKRGPNGVTRTRPLCRFPLAARYKGAGSTDDAANFTCAAQ